MPVYEYACRECRHEFEELVRGDERPSCPRCSSRSLEKRFSVFAAQGGDAPRGSPGRSAVPPIGSCGSCGDPRGPGACSLD
jgi:putative FmdB family regulatory protein